MPCVYSVHAGVTVVKVLRRLGAQKNVPLLWSSERVNFTHLVLHEPSSRGLNCIEVARGCIWYESIFGFTVFKASITGALSGAECSQVDYCAMPFQSDKSHMWKAEGHALEQDEVQLLKPAVHPMNSRF